MAVDPYFLEQNKHVIQSMMKVPAFKTLDESELRDLLQHSEVRDYQAGDMILKEGSYDGKIYYLISGKVKIIKRSKVLLILQRIGDVFGEMGFLEGRGQYRLGIRHGSMRCVLSSMFPISNGFPAKTNMRFDI